MGIHAPGRCTDRNSCPAGNAATEPYLAAHNVLLAHAAAVDVYRKKFNATQGGVVGITVDAEWAEPMTSSAADKEAAEQHLLFQLGWYDHILLTVRALFEWLELGLTKMFLQQY